MSWNNCQYPECEAWAYRPDADYCESHRRSISKEAETSRKQSEKRAAILEKAKQKSQQPRPKPKKISPKREELNKEYKILADEFKRTNPSCIVRVNEYCSGKTESVHHKRGRGRYFLDVSTFLPCCLSCHSYIESHPKEAKEKGFSESRLAKPKETI